MVSIEREKSKSLDYEILKFSMFEMILSMFVCFLYDLISDNIEYSY